MTAYGLDGGDEIFRPSRPVLGPTQQPVQSVSGLFRVGGGRGVGLTPPPPSSAEVLEKSRAIPLLTLRAFVDYKKGENLPT